MNQRLTKYPEGSVRELWKITYPLILAAMSGNLMLYSDRIILSRYSVDAFNAVVNAGAFCWLFLFGAVGVASISEVFVGQYNGAKNKIKMGGAAWQMIWFSIAMIPLFTSIAFSTGEFLVAEQFHAHGLPYFRIIMLAGFLVPLIASFAGFFIGKGVTNLVFISSVLGNVLNIVLDIPLVFGINGVFEPMGAEGAAYATIASQFVQVLILGYFFLNKENREVYGTKFMKFNIKEFSQCLKIGIPSSLSHLIEIGAWALMIRMVGSVSEEHVTLLNFGQTVYILIAFLTDGLQKGVTAVAANYIGSKRPTIIKEMFKSGLKLQAIISAFLIIPFIFFPEILIDISFPEDISFMDNQLFDKYLRIVMVCLWLYFITDGTVWVISGVLTAGGDTRFIMLMNGLGVWFFAIVPIYFFVIKGNAGPIWVWIIPLLYSTINCFFFFWRYKSHKWMSKHVIDSAQEIMNA